MLINKPCLIFFYIIILFQVRYQSIKKEKSGSEDEEQSADERLLGANV